MHTYIQYVYVYNKTCLTLWLANEPINYGSLEEELVLSALRN